MRFTHFLVGVVLLIASGRAVAQEAVQTNKITASISEERRVLKTYPYSDPSPVPVLASDPRLYPYHKYQSYTNTPVDREWTVVKLENDYIEVYVLPEVGGKVWGAIVKASGNEFIYRNETMKFRNISLRGPWTSGGIEFNFGVIGHAPSSASPVDYALVENADGSVSCFVGTMDLPSRTHWRVEIRLPADEAVFETNVMWYNPTPLTQPYYNWMTAAAFAQDDLIFNFPGNQYLRHSGEALPWSIDENGRELSHYANNAFGPSKSYHVVGKLNDFFGGYYAEDGYGFGHWSPYSQMPGQKLWLWALSRAGGIWENLLTDSDGQYIEFQAGRLFVQYSRGSHVNPITEAGFEPYRTDRWTEAWFPVEDIGGVSVASRKGALHAEQRGGELNVSVNAFVRATGTIAVEQNGELMQSRPFEAGPLDVISESFTMDRVHDVKISIDELDLVYETGPGENELIRPFETDSMAFDAFSEADRSSFQGWELLKERKYADAFGYFRKALIENPWHREALLGESELRFRRGEYDLGVAAANKLLQLDAYNADANFQAGIHYRALHRLADSKEAFGWAQRSTKYRSSANAQLAEIALIEQNYGQTIQLALRALDYDAFNINALQTLAIAGRAAGNDEQARLGLNRLDALDPLHQFAAVERFLSAPGDEGMEGVRRLNRSEFPHQVFLELAISYASRGRENDAVRVLELGQELAPSQMGQLWAAYLLKDVAPDQSIRWLALATANETLGRPYRNESIPVLQWAAEQADAWEWRYLLGLDLWASSRTEDAAGLFKALANRPANAGFYVARTALLRDGRGYDSEADLLRAHGLNPTEPAIVLPLIQHLQNRGRWADALAVIGDFSAMYDGAFNIDVLRARSLVNLNRAEEAIAVLENTHVLPSEGSAGGHDVFAQAHLMAGLDRMDQGEFGAAAVHFQNGMQWPETLGAGKPFDPDERMLRFLLGICLERTGKLQAAEESFEAVAEATLSRLDTSQIQHALGYKALQKLNKIAEARSLLRSLKESAHADSPATRWVLTLASENFVPFVDPYTGDEGMWVSLEDRLLERVLSAR